MISLFVLSSLQVGIGTSVGSKLQTSVEPVLELQGSLYEPVGPEETDAYHSISHEKNNELNIEQVKIPHSGVVNEVEENIFKEYTSNDIFSFDTIPTNAPTATFPPLTMSDRVPSSNVHSSNIATARDFFDNFSSDKQNQPSNGSTGITSDVKKSEQVTTVHEQFPVYSYGHLGESQSSIPFSAKDSNSSQSVNVNNSDITTSNESVQVIDSKMDDSAMDNQIHDMETNNQHVTQNTSVLLSTPEHAINPRSSIESLRQLSQQMNGLILHSAPDSAAHIEDHELECRNQELAAMLATAHQKREQLELQLKGYVSNFNM
jgi:hypothetical protein